MRSAAEESDVRSRDLVLLVMVHTLVVVGLVTSLLLG